jgi:CubicO group peptidase (beta-lactamase class C family)
MRRCALLLATLPLLSAMPLAAQDAARDSVLRALDVALAADVAADSIGSISAAVVEDGRVIWARAYGWANREAGVRADTSHLYRVGSISKSFTAVALMQLVERGVVRLDEPVTRALPAIGGLADRPAAAGDITYRHLASHTAGLVREPRLPGAAAGPIADWEDKILASIPTTAYATTPGERYAYSNIGFGILGLTLSRAAATPFMDLVTDVIFRPLGMESSTFILDAALRARLATGYAQRRDGAVDTTQPALEHAGRGYKVPNGGIYSTVGDLARFIAGLTGDAAPGILTDESRQEMFRLQTPGDPEGGYGIGFAIRIDSLGRRFVGHGGSVAGYTAYLLFEPESGLGIVLLRNYGSGATNLGRTAAATLEALLAARAAEQAAQLDGHRTRPYLVAPSNPGSHASSTARSPARRVRRAPAARRLPRRRVGVPRPRGRGDPRPRLGPAAAGDGLPAALAAAGHRPRPARLAAPHG